MKTVKCVFCVGLLLANFSSSTAMAETRITNLEQFFSKQREQHFVKRQTGEPGILRIIPGNRVQIIIGGKKVAGGSWKIKENRGNEKLCLKTVQHKGKCYFVNAQSGGRFKLASK